MNSNLLNNTTSYIVKTGDSLYTIAKKHNTTVEAIMKINHLANSMIYPNQVLFIPKSSTESNDDTYLTKLGDTIHTIIKKYNIDLDTFLKYNDIEKLELLGNQLVKVENNTNLNSVILTTSEDVDSILAKYQTSPYELLKLNEKEWFGTNKRVIIK